MTWFVISYFDPPFTNSISFCVSIDYRNVQTQITGREWEVTANLSGNRAQPPVALGHRKLSQFVKMVGLMSRLKHAQISRWVLMIEWLMVFGSWLCLSHILLTAKLLYSFHVVPTKINMNAQEIFLAYQSKIYVATGHLTLSLWNIFLVRPKLISIILSISTSALEYICVG